MGTALIG